MKRLAAGLIAIVLVCSNLTIPVMANPTLDLPEEYTVEETIQETETETEFETETETETATEVETETEIPFISPDDSVTETFLIDTEAPYDGDYLLVANTALSGNAESTGILPVSGDMANTANGKDTTNGLFSTDDPNVYDFDENGIGLIEPSTVLPELIIQESAEQYVASEVSVPSADYNVGTIRNFYLDTSSDNSYTATSCTCVAIGTYCTVWVPQDDPIYVSSNAKMQSYMQTLAAEFDAQFPKMTEMFGSKEAVDVTYGDNDGKTALLCYDIGGNGMSGSSYVAGYFFGADLNIPYTNKTGNNADCLHIDSWQGMGRSVANGTINPLKSKGTIVHELQHMINFSICRNNETVKYSLKTPDYLNEAYSEAASHLCYGASSSRITYYNNSDNIMNGSISLLEWGNSDVLSNYSLSYLFSQYIRTQYTNDDTIYRDTMNELNQSNNLLSIIAEKIGVTESELLYNFRAALFLKSAQGAYGFHGEAWAEAISGKTLAVSTDNWSTSLKPGAAVVVPLKNTYVPSGAGEHIQFAGMYSDKTADDITVSVTGDTAITKPQGTIQLSATVLPLGVSQSVIYSIPDESQKAIATVSASGLVSALTDGVVTVRATSVYQPDKYDEITITISGQSKVTLNYSKEEVLGGIKITYTAGTPDNAEIYYTTDGTEPTVTSTQMTANGVLFDTVGTHTLKVLGHDPSGECADIVKEETVVLEQLEAPVITAEENFGQVTSQYVTMSAQSGVEIYYTTDGSTPSAQNGTKYIMPFTIDSVGTTTVKAVAVKKGVVNSTIVTKDVAVRYRVMGITLDHTSAELYTNSTQDNRTITLIPTVTPTQAQGTTLQWKSDNPDVATVDDNGTVTAVMPGTTTIHVSADFGTASCEITVKALVESIQITNTTLAVTKDRGTLKLATKVYPDNASDKSLSYKVEPSDRDGEDKGIASITDDGTLTAIKNGVVKVTVTTQDAGKAEQTAYVVLSNQTSYELLYTPKLTQTSFTLNKQSTEGIVFSILPIQENTIDSVQLLSYSDYFALERVEGTENDWQIRFINKQLTPGNYKLAIQITSNDTFNTTINVKVTDGSPKVTLKSVTVNLAYPNAEYPLTVTSKSGSVTVLRIEDDKDAGFTENFEVTDGVLSLKKPYEEFTNNSKNKPVLSGKLLVQTQGYEPQYIKFTVKTTTKVPTLTTAPASFKLNYAKLEQDKEISFTINKKISSKENICLEDIRSVRLDEKAGKNYDKVKELIQDVSCIDGEKVVITFEKTPTGTYTIPLLVSTQEGVNGFADVKCSLKMTIEKETSQPVLTLSTKTVKVNRKTAGETVPISIKSISQSNAVLSDIQCEYAPVTSKINTDSNVKLQYNRDTNKLEAKIEGIPQGNTYKFICTPVYNGVVSKQTIPVTVTVYDKEPAATVSAKGSIDVLNRETSAVTYTIKKSNFVDEIESVSFIAPAKLSASILDGTEYFHPPVLNENGTVSVSAKEDVNFTKGRKYAFRLVLSLKGSGKVVTTKDIVITPKQSAVKLSASGSPVFYTYVNNGNNKKAITLQNNTGKIEKVELNTVAWEKIPSGITAQIGEDGQLKAISFNGDSSVKKGTYTLTFDVYYHGQMWEAPTSKKASYEKPFVYKLKVTVK